MIEMNEQEIQLVSGGENILPGYPTSDPVQSDPLSGNPIIPGIKLNK